MHEEISRYLHNDVPCIERAAGNDEKSGFIILLRTEQTIFFRMPILHRIRNQKPHVEIPA